MAIINTALGPNSYQFDYSTGTTVAEIFAALNAEITNGHGWEVHDQLAGANAVCYRALNKDGTTYKHVVLDLNTSNRLKTNGYESWNSTTHVGTNSVVMLFPSGTSEANMYCGYFNSAPGQIYLFINQHWLAFMTRNPLDGTLNGGGQQQVGISGCFEFSRDNDEDTGAVPCFCMMNTSTLFTTTANGCARTPRLYNGVTGASATIEFGTILGRTEGGTKLTSFVPTSKNPWNNKDWALTLYVHEPNFCVRGRLYGLKASTANAYMVLDRLVVKCDEDYLYDAQGQDKEHHIIPCRNAVDTSSRVIIPV